MATPHMAWRVTPEDEANFRKLTELTGESDRTELIRRALKLMVKSERRKQTRRK